MLTLFANHAGGTCLDTGPAAHDAEHGASTLTLESVLPSVLPHFDHWPWMRAGGAYCAVPPLPTGRSELPPWSTTKPSVRTVKPVTFTPSSATSPSLQRL